MEDFQLGIESYQTQLNLTHPQLSITCPETVADYTVIESPLAVLFRDRYNVLITMRIDEVHKFSDGTLMRVDEALDYRIKEYKVYNRRSGGYTSILTDKTLKLNLKALQAIRKRLQLRRIFRSLESFVGGRIREGDYRLLQRTE